MRKPVLGCIADDFTGATDLANNLVRSGMQVVQAIGVPEGNLNSAADAVVVALKSRTASKTEAIRQSLNALQWLQKQGVQQIYFKYCSTFDSTADGNIGPVTEALMDALADKSHSDFTIATPAFPDNQRTVFNGHLFVGKLLLNESGMQNHPLTPMTDSNLVRVLQLQCQRKVGLIDYTIVAQGETAIRARMSQLRNEGISLAVVDALTNEDLLRLAPALKDLPLITAGSGVAIGLAANFGLSPSSASSCLPVAKGFKAAVSGSCSVTTNKQVGHFIQSGMPALAIDTHRLAQDAGNWNAVVEHALVWAQRQIVHGPLLVYSTVETEAVKAAQSTLGVGETGALVEKTLSHIAAGLVRLGVRQLVVAGGETSGACVQALHINQLTIGPQIDPGVPWCYAKSDLVPDGLHLTLKSGNFGTEDFFTKAFGVLV